MREALGEHLARFQAVYLGEGKDGAWDPTMKDTITLSESFHLCVLFDVNGRRRWGIQALVHTSRRKHFASMLCSLTCSWIQLPAEDDIRVINQRKASLSQRRGAHRSGSLSVMRRMTPWCKRSRWTHHRDFVASIEAWGFRRSGVWGGSRIKAELEDLYSKKCRESQVHSWTAG